MRVVAGAWRGRTLCAPSGRDTRPTSDRVREAIFSAVISRVGSLDGVRVLDLYAGSGALGIEALSRGAAHATFVDDSGRAAVVIRKNLATLGVSAERSTVIVAPVERFARSATAAAPVSLLLADPPYRIDAGVFRQVLEALATCGVVADGALIVYEHAHGSIAELPPGFENAGDKRYGGTVVSFATFEG